MGFKHDYTQTMMMKLFMARPNSLGGSEVVCNFSQALEIVKATDIITVGVPKIIYLVGWQYNGHDDKYPAFFEVNKNLKNPEDETALDSMLKFMEEAEKYNTTISVHVNFADAYENSPVFADYVVNKSLIRTKAGNPAVIEQYNGLPCYKVSYKEEWESGLFKKRTDKLLAMLPIEKAGTIHVDNFQCYANRSPKVSVYEMQVYRKKMIAYLREKGIDITTEFTYREGPLTEIAYGKVVRNRLKTRYPIDLLNKIPAVWWTDKMTDEEIMQMYPHIYGGGLLKNEKFANALYGNIHGEDIWLKNPDPNQWFREFTRQFALINVPFFYLNSKIRKNYISDKSGVTVEYTDGTVSDGKRGMIRNGNKILKNNDYMCLPIYWQENGYIAYSEHSGVHTFYVDGRTASVYKITPTGTELAAETNIHNGQINCDTEDKSLYFIRT